MPGSGHVPDFGSPSANRGNRAGRASIQRESATLLDESGPDIAQGVLEQLHAFSILISSVELAARASSVASFEQPIAFEHMGLTALIALA